MAKSTIGELKDELKHRDRRIEELRQEIDEQRDLLRRMEENIDDSNNVIERCKETFGMTQTERGAWTWEPFWDAHDDLVHEYNDLVHRWNKYLHLINGRTQPVGRPLAASEAQVATVQRLHKGGKSLRWIAEETNLGLNTVRTIVGKISGVDRTTKKHQARIEVDRAQATRWKRQKRTGDALPKQAQRVVEEGRELVKEAKGLGR
jgi:uncharacterized coiled-coil DUF342 family protein